MISPQSKSKSSPRVGFLVAFGPEIRAFDHSGLTSELQKRGISTVLFSREPDPATPAIFFNAEKEPPPIPKIRHLARRARERWLQKQGFEKWHHYLPGPVDSARNLRKPKSLPQILPEFLSTVERCVGQWFGVSRSWKTRFEEQRISSIVVSALNPIVLPAIQAAKSLDIGVHLILNSWKDLYTNPHLHLWPDRIHVWTEAQLQLLRVTNPRFPNDRIQVSGSLHLAALQAAELQSRASFFSAAGLDPSRPFICYSAASPRAVKQEERIVELCLKALGTKTSSKPQILLRLNPMESGERFSTLVQQYPKDLVIQRPEWTWESERDWCSPTRSDASVWRSTIHHSSGNLSIPSTTTVEFRAFGRAVGNICFDPEPLRSDRESIRRYWDAPFYRDIREKEGIHPIESTNEIASILEALVLHKGGTKCHSETHSTTINDICQCIEEVA